MGIIKMIKVIVLLQSLVGLGMVRGQGATPLSKGGCGSLDLTLDRTSHCFPSDGSHHFVCCTHIKDPDNENSPHGNLNPLGEAIKEASKDPNNLSWCTCSEQICEKQLGG